MRAGRVSDKQEFSIALERVDGSPRRWRSGALALPQARVKSVRDIQGNLLSFAPAEDGIAIDSDAEGPLEARLEVAGSLLSREDIERQKLEYEERGRRSTFLWSIGSGVLTAAVTLGIALVNRPSPPRAEQVKAPLNFAELDQCRDSLERVATLANLQDQTLEDLRKLIRSHDEACRDRLEAALASLRR